MLDNRLARVEAAALRDSRVKAIREARKDKGPVKLVTVYDADPIPPNKSGRPRVVLRIVHTHDYGPGSKLARKCVVWPRVGKMATSSTESKGCADRPATGKPADSLIPEPRAHKPGRPATRTTADLVTELARLEAEEAALMKARQL